MKTVYIIWREVDSNVRSDAEVVGVFVGTYEEAESLLERMNKEDGYGWGWHKKYYRTEPAEITTKNVEDFLPH